MAKLPCRTRRWDLFAWRGDVNARTLVLENAALEREITRQANVISVQADEIARLRGRLEDALRRAQGDER